MRIRILCLRILGSIIIGFAFKCLMVCMKYDFKGATTSKRNRDGKTIRLHQRSRHLHEKRERLKRIKEKTRNNTTIGIFFIMTWEDYIALNIHSVSYSH